MRTASEFRDQAKKKAIFIWPHHACSICGEWTAYVFTGGEVYYDSSCGCAYSTPQLRSWADVAQFYNMQTNPEIIVRMDEYWGFDQAQGGSDAK